MEKHRSLCVSPRSIWLPLAGIAAGLILASALLAAAKNWLWNGDPYGIVELFRLNAENNIPSFYSGLLLLIDAGLLAVVWWARVDDGWRRWVWSLLAFLFVFLAFDELFEVHERLIKPLREAWHLSGLLYYAWVVVYAPAAGLVGIVFLPIWLRLKPLHRLRFAVSAILYVMGAIGFEMLGGARYQSAGYGGDIIYFLIYTAEEGLEMAGLIVFAASLMYLLADDLSELHLSIGVARTDRN